jgi:hypothetical protein
MKRRRKAKQDEKASHIGHRAGFFILPPTDLETGKRHYICSMDAVTILVLMLMFAAAVFYIVRKYGGRFKK